MLHIWCTSVMRQFLLTGSCCSAFKSIRELEPQHHETHVWCLLFCRNRFRYAYVSKVLIACFMQKSTDVYRIWCLVRNLSGYKSSWHSPCPLETSLSSLPSSLPPPTVQQSAKETKSTKLPRIKAVQWQQDYSCSWCAGHVHNLLHYLKPLLGSFPLSCPQKVFAASDLFTLGSDQYHEIGVTPKLLKAFCWRAHAAASQLELTDSRNRRVQLQSSSLPYGGCVRVWECFLQLKNRSVAGITGHVNQHKLNIVNTPIIDSKHTLRHRVYGLRDKWS